MSIRTINLGLRPTPTQSVTLGVLQDAFAAACNHISAVAWQEQEFHRVGLQHLVYQDVRALYGLKAQHTIRAIAVVADSYKVDESKQHRFSSAGAVPFDTPRLYQLRGTQVRLSTCGAPVTVEVRLSKHQAQILASGLTLAEADLVQDRKGRWRFLISARFPDAPQPRRYASSLWRRALSKTVAQRVHSTTMQALVACNINTEPCPCQDIGHQRSPQLGTPFVYC